MIYLDASVLVEIYLGQPRFAVARRILAARPAKVSSWMLAIEVPVVLRRCLPTGRRAGSLLRVALGRFDQDMLGVALFDGLPGVADRIRSDSRLSRCRAIDALHVGTAMQIQEMTNHAVQIATFDARVVEVARNVGLPVIQEDSV